MGPKYYFRLFLCLFAVHVLCGLLLGFWDVRLSDIYLKHGQIARIHYWRTLLSHLGLGTAMALLMFLAISTYCRRRRSEIPLTKIITSQVPLAFSYLAFLILGIKIHLVWLDTHLTDPPGLFWTAALLIGCVMLYWLSFVAVSFSLARKRLIPAIVILSVLLITGVHAFQIFRGYPRRSHPNPINILLIVIDTLRWDHLSCYGYPTKTTPTIDDLARESVQYETTISPAPWTTPSIASILTGQFPSRNGVNGRNILLSLESTTLSEVLGRHGYQTAGFINNVYIRRETGIAQGFQQYEEFWGRNECSSLSLLLEFVQDQKKPRPDKGAQETIRAIQDWIQQDWNPHNPFFIFAHFMEPHAIYGKPPNPYTPQFLPPGVTLSQAQKVNQDPELYICGKLNMTDQDFKILNALYDADIRYLDDQIGMLLRILRRQDLLENTLVILTADHGELFGEHHLMSHELSIYEPLVRVPLMIRYPKRFPRGLLIERPVQTIDLFDSILRLAKINEEKLQLQGSSLLPEDLKLRKHEFTFAEHDNIRVVNKIRARFGRTEPAANPLYEPKTLRSARSPQWKLILGSDGTRELYEITKDPYEKENLFSKDSQRAQFLEKVLDEWTSSYTPAPFFKQEQISPEALRELRALGYIQ